MKKMWLPIVLFFFISLSLNAQNFHNVFQDAKALKNIYSRSNKFDSVAYTEWFTILAKYTPVKEPSHYEDFQKYFRKNPFGLSAGELLPQKIAASPSSDGISDVVVVAFGRSVSNGISNAASPFSTSAVADALTQLIIKRAKEELTATFFDQMKKQLEKVPELRIAFPKTSLFISEIESYLYASYLNVLRQAFVEDISNLPFQVGSILRTPRMKIYMSKNPATNNIWLVLPVLQFIGDLRSGKSLPDAIRDIHPDDELRSVDAYYYMLLKALPVLSESIRDPAKTKDWVDFSEIQAFLADGTSSKIFFGLLYQSLAENLPVDLAGKIFNTTNQTKIASIIKTISTGYGDLQLIQKEISDLSQAGKSADLNQLIELVKVSSNILQSTFNDISSLTPANINRPINNIFKAIPELLTTLEYFNDKKYAAGIMNTMVLISHYISKNRSVKVLFTDEEFQKMLTGPDELLEDAVLKTENFIVSVTPEQLKKADKEIKAFRLAKKNLIENSDDDAIKAAIKAIKDIAKISDVVDAPDIYRKLFKYASLMAALSEAKTTEDVTAALEAAILPVGSSSIKSATAISFSINSYIGGAYYKALYDVSGADANLKTIGVALPIGVNFSLATRWKIIGAVSIFASVIDLGAVASYRLSSPDNVKSQILPDFTFQNLLAPGGFIVFNRLLNTPLALGVGAQRAPQLSNITSSGADISKLQTWRIGGFLSVDIPFFNLYSKSLRRPLL